MGEGAVEGYIKVHGERGLLDWNRETRHLDRREGGRLNEDRGINRGIFVFVCNSDHRKRLAPGNKYRCWVLIVLFVLFEGVAAGGLGNRVLFCKDGVCWIVSGVGIEAAGGVVAIRREKCFHPYVATCGGYRSDGGGSTEGGCCCAQ